MKKKIEYQVYDKTVEREINYIPVRYIFAILITILEVAAVIGIVIALCYYLPYFYIAAWLTEIFCVIKIISSDDNPDYKVPWLLFVLILPIAGFMLYFMFYSRKLQKRFVRRLGEAKSLSYQKDEKVLKELAQEDPVAAAQAGMLTKIADTAAFRNTRQRYFPLGEDMFAALLDDLRGAEHFIFMEYFIIEEGKFWNAILDVLREKAAAGVTVRLIYDDIGCMSTLPGNYAGQLARFGIEATPFSRLRGNADSEFNNRSHRKITVIDGKIGYTGGVNIADEYINELMRFGHWKDTAIRLEGEAVWELTSLFLTDYAIQMKRMPSVPQNLYPAQPEGQADGVVIPFGDGPRPMYERRVGKSVIQNMLNSATRYVYMTTPYLIIDNELCGSIEGAALRGVDVRIIVPHIPDKKLVFGITRSFYKRLLEAGVKIYEYTPGFIHAKSYVADDVYAMIGTINLDYRSLVHHFENGVWMYRCAAIRDLCADIEDTMQKSECITLDTMKTGLFARFVRSVVRIFAPML